MISINNLKQYSQNSLKRDKLAKASLWIFMGLLAYMPLHIFLSTWFGTTFKVLEFAKIAKDIVLILGFILVLISAVSKKWLVSLKKDHLAWVIGLYTLLTVLMALVLPNDQDAEILGVVYNLRFLVYFIYGVLLTRLYKSEWLQKNAIRVVLGVALIVMTFGFIQYLWLPSDALTKFGYSRENGVLPAFFIDDKPDLERIMSTIRDPNSLGSYLIIIFSLSLTFLVNTKNQELKKIYTGLLSLSLICLWFTFSRSAWIGAVASLVVVIFLIRSKGKKFRISPKLALVVFAAGLILLSSVVVAKDSYFVKNVILHADESTTLEDPNQLRVRFWRESIESGIKKPLGYGPGTAGLASIRNEIQGTILNENYYFQLLHEVGIVGLVLFIAILVIISFKLFELSMSNNLISIALLASLLGLILTNFLVHIWSNEAVAYTWWGLAGMVVYNLNSSKRTNSK